MSNDDNTNSPEFDRGLAPWKQPDLGSPDEKISSEERDLLLPETPQEETPTERGLVVRDDVIREEPLTEESELPARRTLRDRKKKPQKTPWIALLAIAAITVGILGICYYQGSVKETKDEKINSQQQKLAESFGDLKELRKIEDNELAGMLKLIKSEKGFPAQLLKPEVKDSENIVEGFKKVFITNRQAVQTRSEFEKYYPGGGEQAGLEQMAQAFSLLRYYEKNVEKAHKALERPKHSFGVRYTAGLFDDPKRLDVLDAMMAYALIEATIAQREITDKKFAEALASIEKIAKLTTVQLAEDDLSILYDAAKIQTVLVDLIYKAAQIPDTTLCQMRQLLQVVKQQLLLAPHYDRFLVAQRAIGLHTYEMAKSGQTRSLLPENYYKKLVTEDTLDDIVKLINSNLICDLKNYLRAINDYIAISQRERYYSARRAEIGNTMRRIRKYDDPSNAKGYCFLGVKVLGLGDVDVRIDKKPKKVDSVIVDSQFADTVVRGGREKVFLLRSANMDEKEKPIIPGQELANRMLDFAIIEGELQALYLLLAAAVDTGSGNKFDPTGMPWAINPLSGQTMPVIVGKHEVEVRWVLTSPAPTYRHFKIALPRR